MDLGPRGVEDFLSLLSIVSGDHWLKLVRKYEQLLEVVDQLDFKVIAHDIYRTEIVCVASLDSLRQYRDRVGGGFLYLHFYIIISKGQSITNL